MRRLLFLATFSPLLFRGEILSPGVSVERGIRAKVTHSYEIHLNGSDLLRIRFEQLQFGIEATLVSPDGKRIGSASGPDLPSFVLATVAPDSGIYRLDVSSRVPADESARYRMDCTPPRLASSADDGLIRAQTVFQEGNRQPRSSPEALRNAAANYRTASDLFRSAGDAEGEASALQRLGSVYGLLSDFERAEESLKRVELAWRSLNNSRGERGARFQFCVLDLKRMRTAAAMECGDRVLAESRSSGDVAMQKAVLAFLHGVSVETGEAQRTMGYARQALALAPAAGTLARAQALEMIATAFDRMGEVRAGLAYWREAAGIYRLHGEKAKLPAALQRISLEHTRLGELPAAIRTANEAIALYRAAGQMRLAAGQMRGVTRRLLEMRRYAEAREMAERAINLYHEQRDEVGEAYAKMDVASIYAAMNERDRASEWLEDALRTWPADKGGSALSSLRFAAAKVFHQIGQIPRALELFQQFLDSRPDGPAFPAMLSGIAEAERDAGLLEQARAHAATALERTESIRSGIQGPELRVSFMSAPQGKGHEWSSIDDVYIDVLMAQHESAPAQGHDAEALAASERARARGFIESLSDHTDGSVADPELIGRQRSVQRDLNRAAVLRDENEARRLTGELNEIRGEIRAASPSYTPPGQGAYLGPQAIREHVLTPGSVLLEYWLGEKRSYLWIVTDEALHSFVLPGRAEVERLARRFYGLLTAARLAPKGETPEGRRERLARAEAAYPAAAAALTRTLLKPAAEFLGQRRLLVVAGGPLEYVPFSALPDPMTGGPLIGGHEIVRAPSASALAVVRDRARRHSDRPDAGIAVVADPVFDRDDERLAAPYRGRRQTYADDLRSSAAAANLAASGAALPRLVFSRGEAENIAAADRSGKVFRLLDFHASRAAVQPSALARYRILHFATHGVLNDETPELSGIVLSLVDEHGKAQDGFLRLHEIYDMRLPADLVVLSACQTALGREIRGEGMASISRAFLHAGAARVIAGRWKVDDAATAELMGRFYRKLLAGHLPPAAALRGAQLEMARQPRWKFPYYWAAFELEGEWR